VQKGHSVIVISSKAERRTDIEALCAEAAIGTVQAGADVTIACRDKDKAAEAITGMKARKGTGALEVGHTTFALLYRKS